MVIVLIAVGSAIAGGLIGVYIVGRLGAALTVSPAKMWAFMDVMKAKTIEVYSDELISAIRIRYNDEPHLEEIVQFIENYSKEIVTRAKPRR